MQKERRGGDEMESDDAETVRRIKETVLDVLEEMDMAGMVRAAAAKRLGMDLSLQHRKELVRSVIDSFLESLDCDEEEAVVVREEVEEEEEERDQVQLGEEKETELEEKENGDERVLERRECRHDDAETMKRIVETVWIVLEGADMSCMTEAMVYAAAAERLGMDLSVHPRKKFVQCVVDSFLNSLDYDEKKAGVLQVEVKRNDQMREGEEEEMEVAKKEEGNRRVLGKREYQCDEEKAVVVQVEVRGVEQDKTQEGRKRKRTRPRVRRRRSKMREQSENTVTAVVAGTVQKAAREKEQNKVLEGRRRRRRMQWREQNRNTVCLVKGGLHYRSSEGRHPFQFASSMEKDGEQLPTSIGIAFML